ncbi:hypothetical protein UFOVP237_34 [uncultured Caudovirales phage]|uniref:Uncharacterized protein n=1 Tax=uncultured Caudovirales phage TaxID=2100421 RepID=A0A6J7WY01_9CAUD|nr:hypothetical protein UFOVP237_34 [uncultured Caudovirales phage]
MARGGVRVGAGRKTGTSDRKLRKFSVDQVLNSVGSGPDATPLAFLMGVIHLPAGTEGVKLSDRIQCAIAAAPYVHPRLSSVEMKGDPAAPLQVQSDIGQALQALAELARNRNLIDLDAEPALLEPSSD